MKKIKNYYEFYLKKYKKGHKAVNWKSQKTQEIRFEKITELQNLKGSSILDVGCGLGHLKKYIEKKKIKCFYKGIDISELMIKSAIKYNNNKTKNFFVIDILNQKEKLNFLISDYVINCGLFTVKANYSNKQWWNFIKKMLLKMFSLSKKCIVFNLLTDNVDYKDKHLFYASQKQIMKFIKNNLSEKVVCKRNPQVWENVYYVYK